MLEIFHHKKFCVALLLKECKGKEKGKNKAKPQILQKYRKEMVTCLNVNPWVYFLLSTAADRKAVIKNVSPGFKSCSTPNWGTFVTRFSEPQFLICKMEMNYGLLHRVVFRIKEDNLCKEWGIVVGASQHSIYVGC